MSGAGRALLAEVAGGLLAEHGVLGSQAGDFCAALFRRARSDSAVARSAVRVVAERGGAERRRLIRSRMAGLR
jgi:hypothetical protein